MTATMGHLPYGYLLVPALLLLATSCKKDDEPPAAVSGNSVPSYPSTVVDIDGNVYFVVSVGDQRWMAENLRTTHYADGTEIPNAETANSWIDQGASGLDAMCAYDNDPDNVAIYGYLYNWYAATNPHRVCPSGWHVPTDGDWQRLETAMGMPDDELDDVGTYRGTDQNIGGRLKSTSALWASPNAGASNTSGFSALPTGWRAGITGGFTSPGNYIALWSTTGSDSQTNALMRDLLHLQVGIRRSPSDKRNGYCVRCVAN